MQMDPAIGWSAEITARSQKILLSLKQGEPLQYVLQEAWFDGTPFYVDASVLIPRPETEELLDWIRKDTPPSPAPQRILDVGTGSGILAISLKRCYPNAIVTAIDISDSAIRTAQLNADKKNIDIIFLQRDFTDTNAWNSLGEYDLIVSNPPYISLQEKESMATHVVNYEPAPALFVTGNDPLLFYRLLAAFGKKQLVNNGKLFVEIHEDRSEQTNEIFIQSGYVTEIRKDMQGKQRMIRATRTR
ncbi:MAG: peptide chain release factor N(5)-glutamine methyltransferase [Bacteroidota bacterium]